MLGERVKALEIGEERREESVEERILRPVRRFGQGGERGVEGEEFGAEDLPLPDEGTDGEGREEEEREDVCDEVKKRLEGSG